MEVLLVLALTIATLVLVDVIYGTGILITAIQAGTRYLWRRHPRMAEKLGLGQESCDTQRLNDPAGALVGRIGIVEQAIVAGRGRLAIDGTTWSVQGPDLPVGTLVKITQARENILIVDVA
jgi:membrane protein implicated in regulation of membrane protease activity